MGLIELGFIVLAVLGVGFFAYYLYKEYKKDKRRTDPTISNWYFEDTLDRLFANKVPKRFLE